MTFMLILYILSCFLLIFLVMIQNGSAFGSPGGASSVFFGSSADTVITKMTSIVAFCFFIGTMCLSVLSSGKTSVVEQEAKQLLEKITKQQLVAPKNLEASAPAAIKKTSVKPVKKDVLPASNK